MVGLDQSDEMLAGAERGSQALRRSPAVVELVRGEAEQLPFADGEFDALTFTYLLRYVDDRAATMRELARVVGPAAGSGCSSSGCPRPSRRGRAWRRYTRVGLPLIGSAVSPAWREVGRFLGPSIERLERQEPDLPALWHRPGSATSASAG